MSYVMSSIADHLYTLTEPVSATPFTVSVWFYSEATGANYVATSIDKPDAAGYQCLGQIQASGGEGGAPVRALNNNGSSWGAASTSSGFSSMTWHHACGVYTNATSRAAFIDGGSKGTDSTSIVGVPSELVIGRMRRNSPLGQWFANSLIAEVAVWSSALSDADVALLAGGANPTTIDAGNLVAYWPLTTITQLTDFHGSNNLTDGDTATWSANHPTIAAPTTVVVNGTPVVDNAFYELGEIEMTSGDNSGQKRPIALDATGTITPLWPFVTAIITGDEYNLYPGCDLRGVTCEQKFNNDDIFRGFLYVPKVENTVM